MKRLLALTLLLVLAGCGGSVSGNVPTPQPISWTGDGNPNVPVCPSGVTLNCKITIDIEDMTTDSVVSVSVTQTSYTAPDNSHKYQIRTSGYDENGEALHSPWEPVN